MDRNRRRFYYCTTPDCIEDTIEKGIDPSTATIIIPALQVATTLNAGIMLWDNLQILEGKLYESLVSDGYEFLAVDIPNEHPIERNYDGLSMIAQEHTHLGYLILQMNKPFDPRQIFDEDELRKLAEDISDLPQKGKEQTYFERLMGKISGDQKILKFVFDSALDEYWDINIGFYKTFQAIPPNAPYNIKRFHQ